MKIQNICIVNVNQQGLGIGGTETVSHLLKKEFEINGFTVFCVYVNQKTIKSESDFQFPQRDEIGHKDNLLFLISLIREKSIDLIILQGGYEDELLDICIKAKIETSIKLVLPIHFNPLFAVKQYDDYKDKIISECKGSFNKIFTKLYYKLKQFAYTKRTLKSAKKDIERYDIENINAIVTLNEEYSFFLKSVFAEQFYKKIYTIKNPVLAKQNEQQVKENIILFVGRLTYQKRLDRLLYIWNTIQSENPEWRLVVVGDGEYAGKYKQLAKELQLKNIEFVGQQISEEYFKKSRIVCMTSSHEAQPMVLIEAQLWGCVPIAYNSFEAATDIIQNEHNGLLVRPFKEKEYIKGLRTLIANNEMRERLATNGKEFIKKFDSKTIVKEWIRLFNSL